MLRIATVAVLAISLPALAQPERDGPPNIDKKLDRILERLERLEVRVQHIEKDGPKRDRGPDAREGRDRERPDRERRERHEREMKARVEAMMEFLRGGRHEDARPRRKMRRDADRRHDERGPGPRADRPRGPRPDRDGMRGPRAGGQPFGKLPEIIQAARRGDPRARQMLSRVRHAINEALATESRPDVRPGARAMGRVDGDGQKRVELRVLERDEDVVRRAAKFDADAAAVREVAVDSLRARERIDADMQRVKKLMAESKRLQEEIARLKKELAAQQR